MRSPSRRAFSAGLMLAAGAQIAPAFAQSPSAPRGQFEADRRAILAMAGDFRVRFDMRETVAFVPDYKPIAPSTTRGTEIVRVIADQGRLIQLQHILAMEDNGQPIVIKHWRQDWTFEPRSVLAYERLNHWALRDVAAKDRAGAWSQTVWQTDDSPRYGGVGIWRHADGVSAWTSEPTLRPLARRDAVRHPPYDHYRGANRQAITPTGWVHQQQNSKIGTKGDAPVTFVDENVINTYDRAGDFSIQAGDSYWRATAEYWAAVRAEWESVIARGRGVSVEEEAENGSITGPTLMGLADEVEEGRMTTAAAIAQARQAIAKAT